MHLLRQARSTATPQLPGTQGWQGEIAGATGLACSPGHGAAVSPGRENFEPCVALGQRAKQQQQPGKQDGAGQPWLPAGSLATVLHTTGAESSHGAGSAHGAHRGMAPLLALEGLFHTDVCGPWPHWDTDRHSQLVPGTVSDLFPLSAELQGGAGTDRLAKPRQYGECLPGHLAVRPQLAPCSSAGTSVGQWEALSLHLAPSTHTFTLAAPCTPLPTVLAEEKVPVLCTASSLSSAHPPQVSPCHRLPPSASRCHGFLFCLLQCFMNSILQCLSNTKELRDYCLQNQYLRDLNNNSRMRTALMSGNPQSPAPGSTPCGASLQHIPSAHPCPPGPPHVLGDAHPEVSASPQPCWGRRCAVGAQPVEGLGPVSRGHRAGHRDPRVGC